MATLNEAFDLIGEARLKITLADITAHYGVCVLLASCLADNVPFIETMQRLTPEQMHPKPLAKAA